MLGGMDVVACPFVYGWVKEGKAVVMRVQMEEEEEEECGRGGLGGGGGGGRGGGGDGGSERKRQKVEKTEKEEEEKKKEKGKVNGKEEEEEEEKEEVDGLINLRNKKWRREALPLVKGCKCLACRTPHTRAYIHHLLVCHEMLGEVCLFLHNLEW